MELPQTEIEQHFLTVADERLATRAQVAKLYGVPSTTLADNIRKLKEDGLLHGTEIRSVVSNNRDYMTEVFSLEEVIMIGFRLRSVVALTLQAFAARLTRKKLDDLVGEIAYYKSKTKYCGTGPTHVTYIDKNHENKKIT